VWIWLVLITYVYHNARFKTPKVSLTVWLPTFRGNVMPSSSRVMESYEIRVKKLWSFEYLGSTKPDTNLHFLEDLNPHLHSSKRFRSGTGTCLHLRRDISLLPGFYIPTHPKSKDAISVQGRIKSATTKIKKTETILVQTSFYPPWWILYKDLVCHSQ
jgi:hypothetical protein